MFAAGRRADKIVNNFQSRGEIANFAVMKSLAAKIALRYLVSRKSHRAVNVISAVSLAGVAVATAAIVIVLSVFNGFSAQVSLQLSAIDPDLLVTPVHGKVIAGADTLAARIAALPGVAVAMPSLEERALLVAGDSQLPVRFKGVDSRYSRVVDIDSVVMLGRFEADDAADTLPELPVPGMAAIGVASRLDLHPDHSVVQLYVPRRVGRINTAVPAASFRTAPVAVTGVTQVGQMDADVDRMLIPLGTARALLQYDGGEATAIEIAGDPALATDISRLIGPDYTVAPRERQHPESMRMIAIEKWITFVMLAFILVIAAFNIVSTISLMVVEKRRDMETLRWLGATRTTVRRVFMWQGALITLAGAAIGIVLGLGLSLAQQWGKFVTLGGDHSQMTIDVYPVEVHPADVAAVAGIAIVVAALTSLSTLIFTKRI